MDIHHLIPSRLLPAQSPQKIGQPERWKDYWLDEETRLIHFIGKDNIVFHCIIFPVMLKTEGSYILPDNVPANEFLNLEGDKISTSRNWAVWLHEYLEEFKDKQDVLRYVLCANAPETKDNDFTWKDFQARNNNELLAILGNFVNRALVLTEKYFDGRVPEGHQLILRIDRGSQFRAHHFRETARVLNVTLEYAGVKCPEDKPYIESFIGSYKTEELYRHEYQRFAEARTGWENYRVWYRSERLHQGLNYQSPLWFAKTAEKSILLVA